MSRSARLSRIALIFMVSSVSADVVDDFSGGDWRRFSSTPGALTVRRGALEIADAPGGPEYVTASKVFEIDGDKSPWFLVKVASCSDRGTVKLIRKQPYDKQVALSIDRPGLYAVNMRQRFGWSGPCQIEVCLYAIGDRERITYEFVKFAESLTAEEQRLIAERNAGGNFRLQVAPFEVVPLFHSCSVYFKSRRREGLQMLYRKTGEAWRRALPPVHFPEDGMYRGSIVGLQEDTTYEVKLVDASGQKAAATSFRTWTSQTPVAKTLVLNEKNFQGRMVVRESGAERGWIRLTAAPGFVLRNDRSGPLLELDGVHHVLLDGLTLRGGLQHAITIRRCQSVRVINCDIAGWGRIGRQRFDIDGKYYTDAGSPINWDCAILISRSTGTLIERCYIHDPANHANSWYYSHPAGPQALGIDKPQSTVVRYNDFIGSDEHRWNDAVEGAGNFHIDGGFNRDADIYGNFMCFANDDAIEIDGGQTNVRVFENKFEGCLCGVSIQGCMSGPSYVFRNLLVNMGDERGLAGQTIKTSSHANGPSAVSFIFNNTCVNTGSDLSLRSNLRIVARNNIFAGRRAISGREGSPQSDCDYNLLVNDSPGAEAHGIVAAPKFVDSSAGLFALRPDSAGVGRGILIDNFAPGVNSRAGMGAIPAGSDIDLPTRPVPVRVNRQQLNFTVVDDGDAKAQKVTVVAGGAGFFSPFRIAKNVVFGWFDVTPDHGVLRSGRSVVLTVTVRPDKMRSRSHYRGAFLVRLEDGFSRPIAVYAQTDYAPPVRPKRDGAWVAYREAESPTGGHRYAIVEDASASGGRCIALTGESGKEAAEYSFHLPKSGKCFVVLRVRSDEPVATHDSLYFGIDGETPEYAQLRSAATWTWTLAAHNRKMSLICLQPFELAAGDHVVKLAPREPVFVDLVALTDDPAVFE